MNAFASDVASPIPFHEIEDATLPFCDLGDIFSAGIFFARVLGFQGIGVSAHAKVGCLRRTPVDSILQKVIDS